MRKSVLGLIRLVLSLWAPAVAVGVAVGVLLAGMETFAHQYLSYGLYGLAMDQLMNRLNAWVGTTVALATITGTFGLLIRRFGSSRLRLMILSLVVAAGSVSFLALVGGLDLGDWQSWWASIRPHGLISPAPAVGSLVVVWLAATWNWDRTITRGVRGRIQAVGAVLLLLTLVLNLAFWVAARTGRAAGPNVILVIVDTLRADALGVYGYRRDLTPSLDRLAGESIVFENAIAHAPWTSPSVGAMLTSRYPSELGFQESTRPTRAGDDFLFMAEIFKAGGYRTQAIVSHTYVGESLGFGQGFDAFDSENALGHDHVSSPSITEKASAFLNSVGDDPFFLLVHYFDPHFAYILQPPFDYHADYSGPIRSGMDYEMLKNYIPLMSEEDVDYVRALYDSEVRFTDRYLGVLLNRLRRLQLYRDTVVIFTADHGETFSEREDRWIGHGKTLYQELIHVPLIVKLDGRRPPQFVSQPVGLIDLLPSLVEYLDLAVPGGYRFEGRPLPLGVPDALGSFDPRPIFSETRAQGEWLQSVIHGPRKMILNRVTKEAVLFDLSTDPGELSPVREAPELMRETAVMLSTWARQADQRSRELVREESKLTKKQLEHLRSLGYIR